MDLGEHSHNPLTTHEVPHNPLSEMNNRISEWHVTPVTLSVSVGHPGLCSRFGLRAFPMPGCIIVQSTANRPRAGSIAKAHASGTRLSCSARTVAPLSH